MMTISKEGEMMNSIDRRKNIDLLASRGQYAFAHETKDAWKRQIAEDKKRQEQKLREQQEIEWDAFQKAKACCLENTRFSTAMKNFQYKEALHRTYSNMCKAHGEELEAYTMRVEAEEARRPAVLPRLVTTLRAKESCLSKAGLYNDVLRVQTMIDNVMREELVNQEERRRQVVERKLQKKRKELELRSLSSYRKVLMAQRLKQLQLEKKADVTGANLRHKEDEMAVTHYKQRQALNMPLLEARGFKKMQQLKASRGTQLQKKVCGDHYYVPSLSNMYGNLLEEQ